MMPFIGGASSAVSADVDALHPPGVEGEERLQCLQVVALNEHVAGIGISGGEI